MDAVDSGTMVGAQRFALVGAAPVVFFVRETTEATKWLAALKQGIAMVGLFFSFSWLVKNLRLTPRSLPTVQPQKDAVAAAKAATG